MVCSWTQYHRSVYPGLLFRVVVGTRIPKQFKYRHNKNSALQGEKIISPRCREVVKIWVNFKFRYYHKMSSSQTTDRLRNGELDVLIDTGSSLEKTREDEGCLHGTTWTWIVCQEFMLLVAWPLEEQRVKMRLVSLTRGYIRWIIQMR